MARGSAQLIVKTLRPVFRTHFAFDFCERGTSERTIKSKIQVPFKREAEASSSLKRNKWGQPVPFLPDLSLNSLEWSALEADETDTFNQRA
jgi:hypothetical protein